MSLHRYLTRLYATITSRQELAIESLEIDYIVTEVALFTASLRFFDNSLLTNRLSRHCPNAISYIQSASPSHYRLNFDLETIRTYYDRKTPRGRQQE